MIALPGFLLERRHLFKIAKPGGLRLTLLPPVPMLCLLAC
jgi:hypothetical protein